VKPSQVYVKYKLSDLSSELTSMCIHVFDNSNFASTDRALGAWHGFCLYLGTLTGFGPVEATDNGNTLNSER
jgi:hypothetical protein